MFSGEYSSSMILFPPNLFIVHEIQGYMMSLLTMSTESIYLRTITTDLEISILKSKLLRHLHCLEMIIVLWSFWTNTYLFYHPMHPTFICEPKTRLLLANNYYVRSSANQWVGINVLKNILTKLSEKSGIQVRYTNHSFERLPLRGCLMVRWMKVIAETSGHNSFKKSWAHHVMRGKAAEHLQSTQ